MTDTDAIEQAVEAFRNLSGDNITKLKEFNTNIQNHTGTWGIRRHGKKTASGAKPLPWVEIDPLIYEFIVFMYDNNLLPVFDWTEWSEGSELFVSEDQTKYDNIDLETALKLIFIASRKERFVSGTLAWAFESGGFPKLVNRLVTLGAKHSEQ